MPTQEIEFQYRQGRDTYETLQDRLQRLHSDGMRKLMREEVLYVPNNYATIRASTARSSSRS